jgi:hypothetical protein
VISAQVTRNAAGQVIAFEVRNHGESHVCAAVSMLVINTVNGVEALTEAEFTCDCDEKNGGFIAFALVSPRDGQPGREAGLLLDAMALGLESAAAQHPNELTVDTNPKGI